MSLDPSTREIAGQPALGEGPCLATCCARCGGRLPPTKRGVPRRDARYCSPACRGAATRELRAAAREDLATAIGLLSRALKALGLDPGRPRRLGVRASGRRASARL